MAVVALVLLGRQVGCQSDVRPTLVLLGLKARVVPSLLPPRLGPWWLGVCGAWTCLGSSLVVCPWHPGVLVCREGHAFQHFPESCCGRQWDHAEAGGIG